MEGKDMLGSGSVRGSKDLNFVVALGVIAFAAFFLVSFAYRAHFVGDFSTSSAVWSNFGGYFGGVLGPIVSALTLVTVFKTVLLQREMLIAQSEEFERMNRVQQDQLDGANRQALLLQIASAQDSALKVVELQIAVQEREFDRQNEMVFRITEMFGLDMDSSRRDKLEEYVRQRNRARKLVDLLSGLALGLQSQEFDSVAGVREFLKESLGAIYEEVKELFPQKE
ncbi:hypothetical protein LOY46_14355 [Pseudomonas sichuanensis]|uniref:hypothetical protein n=1 Tax=Pseudomonas sichuanensis TaxID=2213015 RepID=UPI00215F93AA|nr:hypothetical protein [Pseudomonas sichuanensis]UVK80771.1 hypothetical protein LOY46_14355 [Pseudomonas sichuanensis]